MRTLSAIKSDVAAMSALALQMWQGTNRSFLDHDLDALAGVLDDEKKLNQMENTITSELVEIARASFDKKERAQAVLYADITADLEIIGDYCKDILERVEVKIQEKLLFSDDAVKEFEELYLKTEAALKEVAEALKKDSPGLARRVLKNEEHIDSLVDEYREHHNQRLIQGLCVPMACNMFLNILDFTAAVYYHAKKISRNLLKICSN